MALTAFQLIIGDDLGQNENLSSKGNNDGRFMPFISKGPRVI